MSMINATDVEKRIDARLDASVAGALEVSRQSGGLAFSNAGEAIEFAKMMALSKIGVRPHLRENPGACLAIVVQAVEWGMSPFAVANKSYLANDQLGYESQLVQAVILKRAPVIGRFKFEFSGSVTGTRKIVVRSKNGNYEKEITDGDMTCTVSAELREAPGQFVSYKSPPIGMIEVQNSPLWRADPQQQLSYYAGRALCRRHFPDVLLGVYDVDELTDLPRDPRRARDVTPRLPAGDILSDEPRADETKPVRGHTAAENAAAHDAVLATYEESIGVNGDRSPAWLAGYDRGRVGKPRGMIPLVVRENGDTAVKEFQDGWDVGKTEDPNP